MIPAGQQIGGYTVLRQLGRGGMGEVYLAQHRRVARRAAIKVLVPELSQNAVVLERFFNEARAASLIRHPGIVEIIDCDLHLGQAYIIMEFLEGESFGGYLYRTGPLDGDLSFFYGVSAAVASAVGAAHALNIVHRDLKPDNIFLHLPGPPAAGPVVKILDFGIAKLAQQDGAPSQTGTGVLLGTPAYMSPEQCKGAGRVDNRSDIYSLGCILYEALSGGPPFVREGFGELIVAHVSEPPPPLAERVSGVAPDLESLIQRMLAKAPEQRPQTMEDVVVALRACASAAGVSLDGPLRGKVPVERPPEKIESAVTQPAAGAAGPSGADTTPLGPTPRARQVVAPPAAMSAVPSEGSGPLGTGRSGSHRSPPSMSAIPEALGIPAGSTRVLVEPVDPRAEGSRRSTTTFSSTAAETVAKPQRRVGPWAVVAGGAAVAALGAIVVVGMRPGASPSPSAQIRQPAVGQPGQGSAPTPAIPSAHAEAPASPAPEAAQAADKGTPSPSGEGSPARAPETVRIDLQGAPPDTTAEVDGKAAPLPLELPRGPRLHRITLRAPGVPPRTLEIDGTRDRIVDMVVAPVPDARAARETNRRPSGSPRERSRPVDHAAPAAGEKKPSSGSGSSDREAITDI
ncbi:MAG TPA: protein kinase [Polyangia bacterium]